MHTNLFRSNKDTCKTDCDMEKGKDREPVFKTCFEGICFEVFILSDKECIFSKKYRFDSNRIPGDVIDLLCMLPAIKKERIVPIAYLDCLCAVVDSLGLGDLCRRIDASDDEETRILLDDVFKVVIKHKGVKILHFSNSINHKALRDKQVRQEIKSLFFDIDSFFSTIFDMSDDQLVENEVGLSESIKKKTTEAKLSVLAQK